MNTIPKVITRFAPSPTGNLHIGGARTALFNWLFSKNQKGKFLLRIEDTDVQRSKNEYYEQIISTLKWLEINWDEEPYIQSKNLEYHINVANILLKNGHAYKCYCTEKELEEEKNYISRKKFLTLTVKNVEIFWKKSATNLLFLDLNQRWMEKQYLKIWFRVTLKLIIVQ